MSDALERVSGSVLDSWPVGDADLFRGMVRTSDLASASLGTTPNGDGEPGDEPKPMTVSQAMEEAGDARNITEPGFAHVHTDHTLSQALGRMGDSRHNVLPVVSRADVKILLGLITLPDILRAYGVASEEQPQESDSG